VFKNAALGNVTRYGKSASRAAGRSEGSVLTVEFEIEGQAFVALNGGPLFRFTEAVSFAVSCDTQEEIDELWARLTAEGQAKPCGWLKDRFGLSWQIVPAGLHELLQDGDPGRSERVMAALLQMQKLDMQRLQAAYEES